MVSHLPSSFASAAAGQNASRDGARPIRADSRGNGELPRRDGRATNGTLTFRRPSSNSIGQSSAAQPGLLPTDTAAHSPAAATTTPAAADDDLAMSHGQPASAVPDSGPIRYTRESLLDMYKAQQEQCENYGGPADRSSLSRLLMPGWNPAGMNGSSGRGWSRSADSHGSQSSQHAALCWNATGETVPVGLQASSGDDEALFNDINSPLKPGQPKDGGTHSAMATANGRKMSTGGNAGGGHGYGHGHSHVAANPLSAIMSPTSATRPGPRRRELSELASQFGPGPGSGASLSSPTSARLPREDQSSWFVGRMAGEPREAEPEERDDDGPGPGPHAAINPLFGRAPLSGIVRSNTTGNSAVGNTWSSSAAGAAGAAAAAAPMAAAMGSFGNFALSGVPTSINDKRFGASRGESRLAHLMPRDGRDGQDPSSSARIQDPAVSARPWAVLRQPPDGPAPGPDASRPWRSRPRTDTDPFGIGADESSLAGSAALGGSTEPSPPPHRHGRLGRVASSGATDNPTPTAADFGMARLGLGDDGPPSPSVTNPYRSPQGAMGPAAGERRDTASSRDDEDAGGGGRGHGGSSTAAATEREHVSAFGGPAAQTRGFSTGPYEGGNRSHTSSVEPRAYPPQLPGGGGLAAGWAAAGPVAPDHDRPAFGAAFGSSSLFGRGGISTDMASPGLAGSLGMLGSGSGSGRGGAVQTMPHFQEHNSVADSLLPELRHANPLNATMGRGPFGIPGRDTDSPLRSGRGIFDEFFHQAGLARSNTIYTNPEATATSASASAAAAPTSYTPLTGSGLFGPPPGQASLSSAAAAAADPASAQSRQMVMPDRMRWVYLDPQGTIQGPFSGLEMNDWYKANFFTPDLRVRKVEDAEFEPLGSLIRRIGNSREPFLVPQVGVPHGSPAHLQGPFSPSSGTVIPPLSGVFPTFGRTLTAEEQNNLERRKQEEQYLLAQHREVHMRQTVSKFHITPTGPGGGGAGGAGGAAAPPLQHHASAHSLHSQLSFGSMTSPLGMPPMAPPIAAAGNPATFDSASFAQPSSSSASAMMAPREDDESRWRLMMEQQQQQQQPLHHHHYHQIARSSSGGSNGIGGGTAIQPVGASRPAATSPDPLAVSLRSQLPRSEDLAEDEAGFNRRLLQFDQLRAQHEPEEAEEEDEGEDEQAAAELSRPQHHHHLQPQQQSNNSSSSSSRAQSRRVSGEPTKPASSGRHKPMTDASSHATIDLAIPSPFPPALDPLPSESAASTVHRGQRHYDMRLRMDTPEMAPAAAATQPPPLAPWARDPGTESQKGPSLKEIQEAEARKAIKAEEMAAAAKRRQTEYEAAILRERERLTPTSGPGLGLPTSSTWGSGSPVTTSGPWSKPAAAARSGSGAVTPGSGSGAAVATGPTNNLPGQAEKRTLAEIQREEELRKQKAARELAIQSGAPASVASSGSGGGGMKSYANLAGKTASAASASSLLLQQHGVPGSGWSTVGANGKIRMPPPPPPPTGPATQARPTSATPVKASQPAQAASKPVVVKPAPSGFSNSTMNEAQDEFKKWVHAQLSKGLSGNSSINANSLADDLENFPLDSEIIAEAIYANSDLMNGHHFGEEYVRRKRLADKGVVEKQPTMATDSREDGGSGGWNEVAKKGGSGAGAGASHGATVGGRDSDDIMHGAGFRVVPGRKNRKK